MNVYLVVCLTQYKSWQCELICHSIQFIQKKEGRLTTPTTTPTDSVSAANYISHTLADTTEGATMENRRLQLIIPADYFQAERMFWNGRALRALQTQLKSLREEPLEGFRLIINENNLFEWTVGIYGPPDSLYQGGYFKAEINFPMHFPDRPPVMIFTPPIYHPNIYPDGRVCISFLHPPGNDPQSGERADQRWNRDRDMRQILLAVVALLSEPNPDSPANVDAAVSYRRYKQTGSADYLNRIKQDVEKSKLVAIKDNVTVPLTREEYLATGAAGGSKNNAPAEKEEPANKKKMQPAKNPDEIESLPDSSSSDDSDEDGPSTSQQQQNDDDDDEELQSISSFSL